ncbi:MAG: polysaccharide biosynthesis tyrosine autokinase [Alteraurantiacibacter sp. bin_em_oilr2.035]|nr:polysaccharide biosynthesis tyrosine autokinase [Alteraurantiacibacter sp. bin_em_oilr2.035]
MVDRYLPQDTAVESPNGAYGTASRSFFTFATIRGILWRQRFIIIGAVALALLAALIITLLTRPIYQASSTVVYQPPGTSIIEGQDLEPYISTNEVARHMETLAGVVVSRSMAMSVVDNLNLYDSEELLGEMLEQGRPQNMTEEAWLDQRRNAAAGILRGGVSAQTPYDVRIMTINFASTDPRLAARIATGYADTFVQRGISDTSETNEFAREFLQKQIAEIREELRSREIENNSYARSNGLIAMPDPVGSEDGANSGQTQTLTATNLASINATFTQARVARIEAEERWRAVENVPAGRIPEVQASGAVQAQRAQLATMRGQLAELSQRYQDEYPPLQELRAQIETTQSQLQTTENEIKQSLRSAYRIALQQEQALGEEVSRVSDEALNEQDRRVQLSLLDREASALRDQLASLLARYNQLSAASTLQTSSLTKLDPASVPSSPSSPNLLRNLIAGLAAGLALAGGLAVLRETLDDKLYSIDDIETRIGVKALGQTPHITENLDDALENPFSILSEAYSSIRATLDYNVLRDGKEIIQITSAEVGEGKSTTSIALAQRYAAVGKKTLLVDMDLRRPALARRLGIAKNKSAGLIDALFKRAPLDSAIIKGADGGFDLLPISERPDSPISVLSSGLVPELLAQLRLKYDTIIVDSSPLLGLADAPMLARYVDAVLLIVEANRSRAAQTRATIRRLGEVGVEPAGIVLTKFKSLEAGQSYDYKYRYYEYKADD